tara:strand:+ start:66 stop:368 length:303 start_codon:yes stop_codon:yes gene_type:complete
MFTGKGNLDVSPFTSQLFYLKMFTKINKAIALVFIGLITFYQKWISPLLGPSCRFIPTCSAYGIEAVTKHGPWRGGLLTLKRLIKCHPFTPCGCDPVPEK